MQNKRSAFTLKELIVVTAILSLLSGILGAVYVRSVNSAKVTGCISNLSQLGKAMLMYAADNDNLFSPYYMEGTLGAAKAVSGFADSRLWKAALMPYCKEDRIFYCPADRYARQRVKAGDWYVTTVVTSYLIPTVPPQYMQNGIFALSPDQPLLRDKGALCDYSITDANTRPPTVTSMHGKTGVCWYLDGQARAEEIP